MLVSDQVPAPAFTMLVTAPVAVPLTIGPVTRPAPEPPRPSVRVLAATALESVPARVNSPPSDVKFMPLPPVAAIVMSAVSVVSPRRFCTFGVPPLARPLEEPNEAKVLANTLVPAALSTSEPELVPVLGRLITLAAGRADAASIRKAPPPLETVVVPEYVFTPLSAVVAVPLLVTPPVPPAPTRLLATVPSTFAKVTLPEPPVANVMSPDPCEPAAPIVMPPAPAWVMPPEKVLAAAVLVSTSVPDPFLRIPAVPETSPAAVIVEPPSLFIVTAAFSVRPPPSVNDAELPDRRVAVPEAIVSGSGMVAEFAELSR